jgi:phosphatidylserine/phosphatidylglycerophosphate/cardiolipin synthase-like enzyme
MVRGRKRRNSDDQEYNPASDLKTEREEQKAEENSKVTLAQLKPLLREQVGSEDFLPEFRRLLRRTTANRRLVTGIHDELFNIVEHNPPSLAWSRKVLEVVNDELLETRKRLRDAMFFPSEESLNKVISYLNSARRTLEVCIFTITNNRLANALRRAKDRGVEVRVISDDANLEMLGSDVRDLETYGIGVKVDADLKSHMHNKFVLIDDNVLMTGSFNWTVQAVKKNQENLAAVEDPVLVSLFKQEFEKLWLQFSPPLPKAVEVAPPEPIA